jgi:hypothetical protein
MLKLTLVIILFCFALSNCQRQPRKILGAIFDANLKDPGIYDQVHQQSIFATNEYTKIFKANLQNKCSRIKFELVNLTSAQTQLVEGIIFYLNVEIKDSNCLADCPTQKCRFITWKIEWTDFNSLIDSHCI